MMSTMDGSVAEVTTNDATDHRDSEKQNHVMLSNHTVSGESLYNTSTHSGQVFHDSTVNMPSNSSAEVSNATSAEVSSSNSSAEAQLAGVEDDQNNSQLSGMSKKCLRVKFPEDSGVVSGYMDPPTPWHDASACSTEELVAAYVAACERIGVKPLPKLLTQLQVITNFDDRNETLTLKGEHLDSKQCDALEEVFRRVQFRMVDLEATRLDEESAVTMFDLLEYYESCIKLNISYNKNLNARGWQACARMMRKTPCLEQLELRGCSLTDQVMPFLGRSLRMGSPLTTLHLEATVLSGRPLMILVASLKMNEILKELYLADNKLLPSDGIQLGSLLKYNRTLLLLDLRNNHLQDVGMGHVCDGLWEQTSGVGLVTLVVWNNQLTSLAMDGMSKALKNTKSLETINLGHNNITTDGIHRLKEGLLHNKSVMRIGLQAARINCEGAVALAEFIAESQRLVRLDLRENDIKTGGLMALALSLKVSRSVTRIDLDKDPKKESGVRDYAEQQKRLLSDIYSLMSRNHDLARQRDELETSQDTNDPTSISQLCSITSSERPFILEVPEEHQARVEEKKAETRAETSISDDLKADIPTNAEKRPSEEDKVESKEGGKEEDTKVSKEESKVETTSVESDTFNTVQSVDDAELQRRHRMNLSLQFSSRCQSLESPAFIQESAIRQDDPPPSNYFQSDATETTDADDLPKRKIPVDLPASPVVSSQGHGQLVPVFEDALSPLEDHSRSADTRVSQSLVQINAEVGSSLGDETVVKTLEGMNLSDTKDNYRSSDASFIPSQVSQSSAQVDAEVGSSAGNDKVVKRLSNADVARDVRAFSKDSDNDAVKAEVKETTDKNITNDVANNVSAYVSSSFEQALSETSSNEQLHSNIESQVNKCNDISFSGSRSDVVLGEMGKQLLVENTDEMNSSKTSSTQLSDGHIPSVIEVPTNVYTDGLVDNTDIFSAEPVSDISSLDEDQPQVEQSSSGGCSNDDEIAPGLLGKLQQHGQIKPEMNRADEEVEAYSLGICIKQQD